MSLYRASWAAPSAGGPLTSMISRRQLLGAAGIGAAGLALGNLGRVGPAGAASTAALRQPGSLPNPKAKAGTDQLPEIENFVVVMMENHSFDNVLGMSGRGDGFTLGANGLPTATNPDGKGNLVHAFHMPSECQAGGVSQSWNAGHTAYANGTNQGFVEGSSDAAMGYYLESDLPFTWGLVRTFPLADRWFCSLLGQTDPNRRYLISGTSLGQVSDTFPPTLPPHGTIFDSFNKHGITWKDYYSDLPTVGVYLPLLGKPSYSSNLVQMSEFFKDAAAGKLPQFSLLEPNYSDQSEENPQDVSFGDQYLAAVVNSVMQSPQWPKTMLIWTYDEWGGYYDHVPPPAAVTPDTVPPAITSSNLPGGFDRYGFRVPAGVVSPYARRNFVSHAVYDHTSVLKTVETKWNLPALTRRDANALDVLAMVDFTAHPAYLKPPVLPDPADPADSYRCLITGPGTVPPPSAVTPA